MRFVCGIHDALRRKNIDEVNNLLLLHPAVIEKELEKLDVKSPFYIVGESEESTNVFVPNLTIEDGFYCEEMKYYIPRKMMIPIGGMDGRFCIKSYGTYVDQESGMTKERGYFIAERSTGKLLFECVHLKCLSSHVAVVDDFYVTKNQILHHNGDASIYDETGYLIFDEKNGDVTIHFLYDANGDFVTASYDRNKLSSMAVLAPAVEELPFPRNGKLFEQVIIECLKDKKELQGCTVDNLVDMATYLQENNLEFVVNLDTLAVHKANYGRFFRRNGIGQEVKAAPQYVHKKDE